MKKVYQKYANLLSRFLSHKFARIFLRNTYQSIRELPIFYWNEIHETGNLSFLIKSGTHSIKKKLPSALKGYMLSILWRKLLDEHIAKFGFSDNYIAIHRKQKEILRLKIERMTSDNKSLNAFIKIAEEELSEMQSGSGKGSSFYEIKGVLERAGFRISPIETSVEEFYTHVLTLQKQFKKTAS